MKKQIRLLIVLLIMALLIGTLAYASGKYSVKSIQDAIDRIGEVTYSEESRTLIDAVDEKIDALDPNLHLDAKVENIDVLRAAKVRYVEQAIIRLYRAVRDKQDEDTIKSYLSDAEEAFSHYFSEEESSLIHNYQDLLDAREKYSEPDSGKPIDNYQQLIPTEAPELC